MKRPNLIIRGWYSMLVEAYLLNGDPNKPNNSKDPYYLPYTSLATVGYNGAGAPGGAGGISGSGVLKFVDNDATLPGPEPLTLKYFTIFTGSEYWIDPNLRTGRAVFVYKLYNGDIHTVHYAFVIEGKGQSIKFISTISEPTNSVQWGTQTRL